MKMYINVATFMFPFKHRTTLADDNDNDNKTRENHEREIKRGKSAKY